MNIVVEEEATMTALNLAALACVTTLNEAIVQGEIHADFLTGTLPRVPPLVDVVMEIITAQAIGMTSGHLDAIAIAREVEVDMVTTPVVAAEIEMRPLEGAVASAMAATARASR
eukprot:gene890-995_t